MKFEVAALIAQIEERIKAIEADVVKKNADEKAKVAEKRQEWLDKNKADLIQFADKLKEKLRKDRPILPSDVPHDLFNQYRTGTASIDLFIEHKAHVYKPRTAELESLLNALKAVTSTEISPTAIRALGFKNLRELF